jgi:hypothetical protein
MCGPKPEALQPPAWRDIENLSLRTDKRDG